MMVAMKIFNKILHNSLLFCNSRISIVYWTEILSKKFYSRLYSFSWRLKPYSSMNSTFMPYLYLRFLRIEIDVYKKYTNWNFRWYFIVVCIIMIKYKTVYDIFILVNTVSGTFFLRCNQPVVCEYRQGEE